VPQWCFIRNYYQNGEKQLREMRKVPVGTTGGLGQLHTVYAVPWICPDCKQQNSANKNRCVRCKKLRTVENLLLDPAVVALQEGKEIPWQEVIDPSSNQIYYHNKITGVTQWERPEEMGAAPLATGWFGRGQTGSNAAQRFSVNNDLYLSRPARKQKDFVDPKKYVSEGANEFNIWYGKYNGDREEIDRDPAPDRCSLENDAGYTKADTTAINKGKRHFCLMFARGACAKGADCTFFHRIPTPDDDALCDEIVDCFGRQRHAKHRDNMNGTGSFMKPSRTLFVGNLQKSKYKTPEVLEASLWKHFSEWGELENVNVIHRQSIAFPRYRLRTSAEFAKVAMSNQALDFDEVLSVRWAHDDPNPLAQDAISRSDKDALVAMLQARGVSLAPAPYAYPSDYSLPATKKMRVGEYNSSDGDGIEAYPDTDSQYPIYQDQPYLSSGTGSDHADAPCRVDTDKEE